MSERHRGKLNRFLLFNCDAGRITGRVHANRCLCGYTTRFVLFSFPFFCAIAIATAQLTCGHDYPSPLSPGRPLDDEKTSCLTDVAAERSTQARQGEGKPDSKQADSNQTKSSEKKGEWLSPPSRSAARLLAAGWSGRWLACSQSTRRMRSRQLQRSASRGSSPITIAGGLPSAARCT